MYNKKWLFYTSFAQGLQTTMLGMYSPCFVDWLCGFKLVEGYIEMVLYRIQSDCEEVTLSVLWKRISKVTSLMLS